MALGKLYSLRDNLSRKNNYLEIYHNLIKGNLDLGFIERVDNNYSKLKTHYLPHHAVEKSSITTPIRIVYNCSAKVKGSNSLNDCLLKGPSMTAKLFDILLKFRIDTFAFTADISKAFLRVGLQESERDFLRFLWFEDPSDINSKLVCYRFKAVPFGSTSSPFLLQATMDFHLKNSKSPYKDIIASNFYVDNLQFSVNNEEKLINIYNEANRLMLIANMPLRMWVTNNKKLRNIIHHDFPDYIMPNMSNVLGLQWNVYDDLLSIKIVTNKLKILSTLTKRQLLSLVSVVFDPLGFLAPVLIRGKLLFQKVWKLNELSWDDLLPAEFIDEWNNLVPDLISLKNIALPRKIIDSKFNYEVHVFCDASPTAYGCVIYFLNFDKCNMLLSKPKVAPLKSRSLPQLELTSIYLGVKLVNNVLLILNNIVVKNIFIWSDNEA